MKRLEWYRHLIEEVFSYLQTSTAGLTDDEARKRLAEYGYNE